MWAGINDLVLENRLWQWWWAVISVTELQKVWLPSCKQIFSVVFLACMLWWSKMLCGRHTWQGNERNLCPKASKELRSLVQQPVRNWMLPVLNWVSLGSRSLPSWTSDNNVDSGPTPSLRDHEAEDPNKLCPDLELKRDIIFKAVLPGKRHIMLQKMSSGAFLSSFQWKDLGNWINWLVEISLGNVKYLWPPDLNKILGSRAKVSHLLKCS